MTKENFLFGIIGLLLGCIVGFMFANSVNQNAVKPVAATTMNPNAAMPPGHPEIGNTGAMQLQLIRRKPNPKISKRKSPPPKCITKFSVSTKRSNF
jgi:hypothetical protein